ncbi:hypothetical protein J2S49_001553 [Arcanobacterium wilhelmae]|uniref:DUF3117 domain-containing protein n=1 Tax=Arcanobacterium wilhelmae TaxID=1803177 RepID=A0ABT9NCM9_9ACTO|nr:DUF3117 domain-containing protein [Arcanobacterium wilhelmae]MDP9801477.1 hypothetical protein [Arcanobacterium wilhelmae]WFN90808.1 DUF3117 domain-containing protein [Arcanobacterium wilhelmae]
MAAMKPRTGDGPLEVEKSPHGYTLRLPLEGGGRMVLQMSEEELAQLRGVVSEALGE